MKYLVKIFVVTFLLLVCTYAQAEQKTVYMDISNLILTQYSVYYKYPNLINDILVILYKIKELPNELISIICDYYICGVIYTY